MRRSYSLIVLCTLMLFLVLLGALTQRESVQPRELQPISLDQLALELEHQFALTVEVQGDELHAYTPDFAQMVTLRKAGDEIVHVLLTVPSSLVTTSAEALPKPADLVRWCSEKMEVPPSESLGLINWAVIHQGDPREPATAVRDKTLRASAGDRDISFSITRN